DAVHHARHAGGDVGLALRLQHADRLDAGDEGLRLGGREVHVALEDDLGRGQGGAAGGGGDAVPAAAGGGERRQEKQTEEAARAVHRGGSFRGQGLGGDGSGEA